MFDVSNVLIFEKSGTPIVMFDFKKHDVVVDEILISGFLSAINGFTSEVFSKTTDHFIVDQGNQKLTVFKQGEFMLTVFSTSDIMVVERKVHELMDYIGSTLAISLSNQESNKLHFGTIRRKLIRIFFYIPIAEDWMVKLDPTRGNVDTYRSEFPVLDELDQPKRIKELSFFRENQGATGESDGIEGRTITDAYEVLNYLHHEGVISFDSTVEFRDYIMGRENIAEVIEQGTRAPRLGLDAFPEINVINLVQDLKRIRLVQELIATHGKSVVKLLTILYNAGYVYLFNEEQRRVLLSRDISRNILRIIAKLLPEKQVADLVSNARNSIASPAITLAITIKGNKVSIIEDASIKSEFHEKHLVEAGAAWISFSKELISLAYQRLKKKFVKELYSLLMESTITLIHENDLDLLNPLLLQLEEIHA
ncbi:MAG: hypothetical protein ACTSUE_13815 [Promethearchaeota archaeon]